MMLSATETPHPFHAVAVRGLWRTGALFSAFVAVLAITFTRASDAVPGQPGTLDTTWATASPLGAGKLMTAIGGGNDAASAIAVQPDGKIVVAGTCHNGSDNDFCVARYTVSGLLDATFGSGGKVITDISGADDYANALALQADGKIVVAGSCYSIGLDFCLARYNANGVLDATFGTGGTLVTTITGLDDVAAALALQPDGRIVVAGYCYTGGPGSDFCLARYNADGTIDTNFGSGGQVFTAITANDDPARALALQPDGKIVVAGTCSDAFCLARYSSTGVLDPSFGSSGSVVTNIGTGLVRAVALQPDGKIVVAGACVNGNWDFCLTRYGSSGALDLSFGSNGIVATPVNGTNNEYVRALALQPDGRIAVAGYCHNGSNDDFCLARYLPSGALDPSFGSGGKVVTPIGLSTDVANALVLQPDGKFVVAGTCNNGSNDDFCLARYDGGPFAARNCSMDVDGDGVVLATTDMLIVTRIALAISGPAALNGISFASHARRTTWPEIRDYLVSQCGMSIVP